MVKINWRVAGWAVGVFNLCLSVSTSSAITWIKIYGGSGNNEGRAVCETPDNGYMVVGFLSGKSCLLKVDSLGDTVWTKTLAVFSGNCIQPTSDGGFVIVGAALIDNSDDDVLLLKVDSLGNALWFKTYGDRSFGESGLAFQSTKDGGFILGGHTWNGPDKERLTDLSGHGRGIINSTEKNSRLLSGAYLIKTDSLGNPRWIREYGGMNLFSGVYEAADGGFLVFGTDNYRIFESGDVMLLKTDYRGEFLSLILYGGDSEDMGSAVDRTDDGGYIIGGSTRSFGFGGGWSDVWLLKTDSEGDTLWTRTFGRPGYSSPPDSSDEDCMAVRQTRDRGYILLGYSAPFEGGVNFYLLKTDSSGNKEWHNQLGDRKYGYDLMQTRDGGYLIVGQGTNGKSSGVLLIKTDSVGTVGVTERPARTVDTVRPVRFQVYPNPAARRAQIFYSITRTGPIRLQVYEVSGRLVRNFLNNVDRTSGNYCTVWDGTDDRGNQVGSGVYFLRLEQNGLTALRRIEFLR